MIYRKDVFEPLFFLVAEVLPQLPNVFVNRIAAPIESYEISILRKVPSKSFARVVNTSLGSNI